MKDPASLSPPERATISFFVALWAMRTPAAAQQVTAVANAAFQTAASEFLSDRRAVAERHRETSGSLADDDEIERLRQESLDAVRRGGVRVSGEGGAAFGAALEHAVSNVPAVFAFDWTLLRATNGGLITSDRGIAIHDPTPPYPWAAQSLLGFGPRRRIHANSALQRGLRRLVRWRRRDSDPRHADYDSAALWLYSAVCEGWGTRKGT
jgi:hypothetical protein